MPNAPKVPNYTIRILGTKKASEIGWAIGWAKQKLLYLARQVKHSRRYYYHTAFKGVKSIELFFNAHAGLWTVTFRTEAGGAFASIYAADTMEILFSDTPSAGLPTFGSELKNARNFALSDPEDPAQNNFLPDINGTVPIANRLDFTQEEALIPFARKEMGDKLIAGGLVEAWQKMSIDIRPDFQFGDIQFGTKLCLMQSPTEWTSRGIFPLVVMGLTPFYIDVANQLITLIIQERTFTHTTIGDNLLTKVDPGAGPSLFFDHATAHVVTMNLNDWYRGIEDIPQLSETQTSIAAEESVTIDWHTFTGIDAGTLPAEDGPFILNTLDSIIIPGQTTGTIFFDSITRGTITDGVAVSISIITTITTDFGFGVNTPLDYTDIDFNAPVRVGVPRVIDIRPFLAGGSFTQNDISFITWARVEPGARWKDSTSVSAVQGAVEVDVSFTTYRYASEATEGQTWFEPFSARDSEATPAIFAQTYVRINPFQWAQFRTWRSNRAEGDARGFGQPGPFGIEAAMHSYVFITEDPGVWVKLRVVNGIMNSEVVPQEPPRSATEEITHDNPGLGFSYFVPGGDTAVNETIFPVRRDETKSLGFATYQAKQVLDPIPVVPLEDIQGIHSLLFNAKTLDGSQRINIGRPLVTDSVSGITVVSDPILRTSEQFYKNGVSIFGPDAATSGMIDGMNPDQPLNFFTTLERVVFEDRDILKFATKFADRMELTYRLEPRFYNAVLNTLTFTGSSMQHNVLDIPPAGTTASGRLHSFFWSNAGGAGIHGAAMVVYRTGFGDAVAAYRLDPENEVLKAAALAETVVLFNNFVSDELVLAVNDLVGQRYIIVQ